MKRVDLSDAEVIDAHCHPYRLSELLERGSDGFDTRMTFMGESFLSSSQMAPELWAAVDAMTDSTMYAQVLRRWLAERLGCPPTREAITAARSAALQDDPVGYVRALLDDQHITQVLVDDGFPQPPVPAAEFASTIGVPAHRVARLEPWILQHREGSFDDLVGGVQQEVRAAAADGCVAFKSIIAYRAGLDVTDPAPAEAAEAHAAWREQGWPEGRGASKTVRDFLLHRALDVARTEDRPFHIHCGAGDPDIDLPHVRPAELWRLLVAHQRQAIVLIHAGYPWFREAAHIASVMPQVHLEISELVPWGWSMVEQALEAMLGTAPWSKVLHGSDMAGEPEAFWVSARLVRGSLERVLDGLCERDFLIPEEADTAGRAVLAGNARRLHGLD